MQGWSAAAAAAMDGETKGVDDNLSFRVQSVSQSVRVRYAEEIPTPYAKGYPLCSVVSPLILPFRII